MQHTGYQNGHLWRVSITIKLHNSKNGYFDMPRKPHNILFEDKVNDLQILFGFYRQEM